MTLPADEVGVDDGDTLHPFSSDREFLSQLILKK